MAYAVTEVKAMCESGLESEAAKDERGLNLLEIHLIKRRQ